MSLSLQLKYVIGFIIGIFFILFSIALISKFSRFGIIGAFLIALLILAAVIPVAYKMAMGDT